MLEACHSDGDHGDVKMCLKESPSHRSMGEKFTRLHQERASMHNQERRSNLKRIRLSSSSSSGMRKARYDLDRFSLLPVSWCKLGDRVIG